MPSDPKRNTLDRDALHSQLANVLERTNFDFLGSRYEGKVRDCYVKDSVRFLIASDRLSCFDRVVTSIPCKGEVLTRMAQHWFALSHDILPNHIIDVPDPNVMVVQECEIFPIEVVVRAYLTGSAWRDYSAGKAISGIKLASGMKASQKLETPIITPSTKAAKGSHDEPISEAEILARGLVAPRLWQQACEAAHALFALGVTEAAKQGLLLVDTKYEFGIKEGKLILADEIHTLDSSRYWIAQSWAERFAKGETPEMLDKEPVRQWLLERGFKGDGEIPFFSDDHRVEIAEHYIKSYQKVTGCDFEIEVEPVAARVEKALRRFV